VGRGERFLELGGHSLVAMQLILRVRAAFGIELPLNVLYSSNLEEMAAAVTRAQAERLDSGLLAELLDEVEQMSGSQIEAALDDSSVQSDRGGEGGGDE
jgi:hypothetical protein